AREVDEAGEAIAEGMGQAELRRRIGEFVDTIGDALEKAGDAVRRQIAIVVARIFEAQARGERGGRIETPDAVNIGGENERLHGVIVMEALHIKTACGAGLVFLQIAIRVFGVETEDELMTALEIEVIAGEQSAGPMAVALYRLAGLEVHEKVHAV